MADEEHQEQEMGQQGGDPGWAHGTLVDAARRRVKCNWCQKEMNGGVYRLKQHIAGISGNVSKCHSCPSEVSKEMRAYMTGKKKEKTLTGQQQHDLQAEISGRPSRRDYRLPLDVDSDEDDSEEGSDPEFSVAARASLRTLAEDEERRRGIGSSSSGGRASTGSSLPRASSIHRVASTLGIGGRGRADPGPMDPYLYRSRSTKQPSIKQAMKGAKAGAKVVKGALKGIVKWFLHAGVPAHTASSPYFQTMVDAIAEAGRGLKAPTPRYIYDIGLEEEMGELKAWVDGFKVVWKERGCTIMCDGWTGTTRKSMINFLVYCSEGTIFLKSVDASNHIKTANYLFNLMDAVVDEIGEENVVQVVTDNEASYKAAGKLLMEKRKHLYWVPCAAHCLDLMMEDIGKDRNVAQLVEEAQMITSFIYSHNRILNMMRVYTEGGDLLRPGPTRFASNFISLESLLKYRHQLGQLIHSEEYLQHVDTLRGGSRDAAVQIQALIGNSRFWDRVAYYLRVIEPLVQVLRLVDGDDKNDMGYLYEAMDKAKERLREKNPTAYKKWWDIIDKRWEMTLHHDLHAAGYFFNPRFQYSDSVHNDGEIMRGTMNVITRLARTINEKLDALAEVDRFKLKLGIYSDYDTQCAVPRISPAEWWIQVNYKQANTNPLAYIAVRVLSQTTSSSQCERNWSTFSLIHTKIRNRLGVSRLEKLVYCHYNMRLRIKQIQERQRLERKRFMQLAGRAVEEPIVEVDLDELLDEEHPLNAWVESRDERDAPVFDPQDRSWAEGELDLVRARDPEFQEEPPASLPERHRHSATEGGTGRLSSSQPELRRSATQLDPKRKKESRKSKGQKQRRTEEIRSKHREQDIQEHAAEPFSEVPPLPPRLATLYEREKHHYERRRKRDVEKGKQVGSDDSTQDPDDHDGDGDDDDDGAAAGTGASGGGYGLGGILSGYEDYPAPPSQQEGSQGQGEGQERYGGYEGQQRQAGYDWGQEPSYPPFFQPPTLEYSDISGTSGAGYSGQHNIGYGSFFPRAGSEESSSQQATTPRGIQRGFQDLADSLFGYRYTYEDEESHMSS